MAFLNEPIAEYAALERFGVLGYSCLGAEALTLALSHGDREAIRRPNPATIEKAKEEALRKVLRVGTPLLAQTNRVFQWMPRATLLLKWRSGKFCMADSVC